MKLTIDKVRALRDLLKAEGAVVGNDNATASALCDEWIATHTVRWDDGVLRMVADAEPFAWVYEMRYERDKWGGALATMKAGRSNSTKDDARAWCEEQARSRGLEVAT